MSDHPIGNATPGGGSSRALVLAAIPIAAAIGVFGMVFGAAATPLLGPGRTIVASLLIFSGAVQLALVGLLLSHASPGALLLTAMMLNLRNLVLGAVLRPHLPASVPRRLGLAWFVIDETVGLTLANPARASATLATTGSMAYGGWVAGTILGIVAGAPDQVRPMATAMFPVLFVGLSALATTRRGMIVRVAGAGALTVALSLLWPAGRGLSPMLAAMVVALPGTVE